MVVLATAHPAKFSDAVREATGEEALPPVWGDIPADRPETVAHLVGERARIEAFILERARLARG